MSEQITSPGIAVPKIVGDPNPRPGGAPPPDPDRWMRRGPAGEDDLGWKRQPMVRWFSPGQLAVTAVRAVLSSTFGAYADRREVQAALYQNETDDAASGQSSGGPRIHHYEGRAHPQDGFWIDYVADLGDGFRPTYMMAWLLAQPSLPLPAAGKQAPVERDRPTRAEGVEPTPAGRTRRGSVLVMGGDQVYPTASRDEYANRMSGPYEAALPCHRDGTHPHLFAIPGNHDWYDGLTSFMRLFCQKRWIGGWQTRQSRSYFALKLPNRWWLLGVDVQLQADIDQPQMEYFCRVAEQMQEGDRVILCTAEPAWVHTESDPSAFDNLAYFESVVLAPRKAVLSLTLTGDLHHYSRYTDAVRDGDAKRHKITAGGGGAYLLGTQLLPKKIDLETAQARGDAPAATPPKEAYVRKAVYPSMARSLFMKWGALRLAWHNPSFAFLMGTVYTVFAWLLQSASATSAVYEGTFFHTAATTRPGNFRTLLGKLWEVCADSPLVLAFALLIVGGMVAFCNPDVERSRLLVKHRALRTVVKCVVGAVHGLAHVVLAVGMIWALCRLTFGEVGVDQWTGWTGVGYSLLFAGEMMLAGGLLGAVLMSLFLLPGVNYNEAFSAQHLEGYKNFVRLNIRPDGTLKVYPYGVDASVDWNFHPDADPGEPYFDPKKPPKVRLVDEVLTLSAPGS